MGDNTTYQGGNLVKFGEEEVDHGRNDWYGGPASTNALYTLDTRSMPISFKIECIHVALTFRGKFPPPKCLCRCILYIH